VGNVTFRFGGGVVVFVYILVCVLCKYFCFKKKYIYIYIFCTMRSNVPCTFDRRHEPAFELTCVCSSVEPHLTHTLLHICDRTYPLRSNAYTSLHSNSLAFVRAQSPLHTHTLSTNAIERTFIRSIACNLSPHVTFF
jgi:hypothetical protein